MDKELRILLLEENQSSADLLTTTLRKADLKHNLQKVESKDKFIYELDKFNPDVILSNYSTNGINSLEALEIARSKKSDVPFILFSDAVSEQVVEECIRAGVDDYIQKSSLVRLPASIKNVFLRAEAKKEKEKIESLHEELKVAYTEIEENNKNMMDSINYAKLIQEAMLPEKAVLTNYFPNSLIIYRPKDIVSGDFYWFVERDKKLLIAVADCTGHGVPGSLMSMIGYSMLNEIVNVKNILKPSEILARLNVGIRRTLKQDKIGNQRCDGMDIALCSIDRTAKTIEFAGANRHLIFFRDKTLDLIKGDKFGIGGLHNESSINFKNNFLSYDEGDVLYMCTDGYADQFGGTKGKRMMTRNMIKILEKSLSFGVNDQEQLLNHWLDKWQGNYEQTDDILLIGIQL
ncbi:MAG: response regulator [Bacteroidia bacterium]|nr:response regulator [Bacteroidia bacterium]